MVYQIRIFLSVLLFLNWRINFFVFIAAVYIAFDLVLISIMWFIKAKKSEHNKFIYTVCVCV